MPAMDYDRVAHLYDTYVQWEYEVLNDVVVSGSAADLGDAEESDQFFLSHDGGTRAKSAIRGRQDGRYRSVLLSDVHHGSLGSFWEVSARIVRDCRETGGRVPTVPPCEDVLGATGYRQRSRDGCRGLHQ